MTYFLCYPMGNRNKITVIDLEDCVGYERTEWANVNDETFSSPEDAVKRGREIAKAKGLLYILFKSRYDPETSEVEPRVSETDCRSEAGVTVGLIDSVITICRILSERTQSHQAVTEALADLFDDEDFRELQSRATSAKRAVLGFAPKKTKA